jgi:hypothetical protein
MLLYDLLISGNQNLLKCDAVWKKLLDNYNRLGCVVNAKDQNLPWPRQH